MKQLTKIKNKTVWIKEAKCKKCGKNSLHIEIKIKKSNYVSATIKCKSCMAESTIDLELR